MTSTRACVTWVNNTVIQRLVCMYWVIKEIITNPLKKKILWFLPMLRPCFLKLFACLQLGKCVCLHLCVLTWPLSVGRWLPQHCRDPHLTGTEQIQTSRVKIHTYLVSKNLHRFIIFNMYPYIILRALLRRSVGEGSAVPRSVHL